MCTCVCGPSSQVCLCLQYVCVSVLVAEILCVCVILLHIFSGGFLGKWLSGVCVCVSVCV